MKIYLNSLTIINTVQKKGKNHLLMNGCNMYTISLQGWRVSVALCNRLTNDNYNISLTEINWCKKSWITTVAAFSNSLSTATTAMSAQHTGEIMVYLVFESIAKFTVDILNYSWVQWRSSRILIAYIWRCPQLSAKLDQIWFILVQLMSWGSYFLEVAIPT